MAVSVFVQYYKMAVVVFVHVDEIDDGFDSFL